MSKAFLRESEFGDIPNLPPPTSPLPPGAKNYVTPRGAEQLRRRLARLTDEERPSLVAESTVDAEAKRALQALDHRIRYLRESLRTAEIVPPPAERDGVVRFGATVTVRGIDGERSTYRLLGVDEAQPERGWVSWTSPIARALMNARQGERVKFSTPSGLQELEIEEVHYEGND
jgi:transcription elongation factor GreB